MSIDRFSRRRAGLLAVLLGLTLAGCATGRPDSWRNPEALPQAHGFHAPDGRTTQRLHLLMEVYTKVIAAAGALEPELVVTDGEAPNAYAVVEGGKSGIGINLPMLALLGEDRDALAALVGHELAHLYLRHQVERKKRAQEQDNTSGLLGFVLSAVGLPFGALLVDAATATYERGASRDDEREADRLGVVFMRQAGFDPAGAVRLQEKLAQAGEALIPFLSTHPGGAERIEAMKALAQPQPRPE